MVSPWTIKWDQIDVFQNTRCHMMQDKAAWSLSFYKFKDKGYLIIIVVWNLFVPEFFNEMLRKLTL